jgi:hypothetical protein
MTTNTQLLVVTVGEIDALSERLAKATADVRDLRSKLAFERQRQLERGQEIALENAMLRAHADDKQTLPE